MHVYICVQARLVCLCICVYIWVCHGCVRVCEHALCAGVAKVHMCAYGRPLGVCVHMCIARGHGRGACVQTAGCALLPS